MQPWFEAVSIPSGQSCLVYDRQLPAFAFNWHYHPEYELTLTLGSRGTRHVGGHVAPYGDGDLVLLGPNLPHAWQSEASLAGDGVHRAIVCWFTQGWIEGLIGLMPELAALAPLIGAAERGVAFGPECAGRLRARILGLCDLPQGARIVALQSILVALAEAEDRRTLAAGAVSLDAMPRDRDRLRMERILAWLHDHYDQPIRLAPLCARAHVTESQLQRIFRRSTRMSVSEYVTRLRVGRACTLLIATGQGMSAIAEACGFADSAHFARKFRAMTGRTPSEYRREFHASGPAIPEGVFPMRKNRGPVVEKPATPAS